MALSLLLLTTASFACEVEVTEPPAELRSLALSTEHFLNTQIRPNMGGPAYDMIPCEQFTTIQSREVEFYSDCGLDRPACPTKPNGSSWLTISFIALGAIACAEVFIRTRK